MDLPYCFSSSLGISFIEKVDYAICLAVELNKLSKTSLP